MDRFPQQAVILALLNAMKEQGSWCGETHVQKCVYFLKEGLKVPLGLDFVLYKHGPFSFDLRELLGEMRSILLIDIEQRRPYGPSLVVSESGQSLASRFPRTISQWTPHIEFVSNNLADKDVASLERLSTALYVKREYREAPATERALRIVDLKPHISEERAKSAVEEVDKLLADASGIRDSS